MSGTVDQQAVIAFIYREARLIDERDLDRWFDLFSEDAIYWMPLKRGQREADQHSALFFEDRLLLKVRIERLKHPRAFSQAVPSYCQHVLQAPQIETVADSEFVHTQTPFLYLESQGDQQITLGGVAFHQLREADGDFSIYRKRIELVNREAALPSIQSFL